jgi:hypothetical protein
MVLADPTYIERCVADQWVCVLVGCTYICTQPLLANEHVQSLLRSYVHHRVDTSGKFLHCKLKPVNSIIF